ncbi:MAG: hypothetical protein RLY31_2049 [Bacteroidota bacterium]
MSAAILLAVLAISCQSADPSDASAPAPVLVSPEEDYPDLLRAAQLQRVFPDGKTFVDCRPTSPPKQIRELYQSRQGLPGFDLAAFVREHFEAPVPYASGFVSDTSLSAAEHVRSLWPVLTRQPEAAAQVGTLIPLPHPYVVPGGRFGEIYYWDSYFTMLGLQVSGQEEMMANMVANFAWLTDRFGFIPNGNRTYFLGRSQPPFFSLMVGLLAESRGDSVWTTYLPHLEQEHAFWMEGAAELSADQPEHRRVVRLPDGAILNRYWDDRPGPRPESYREDVETAGRSGRPAAEVYTHLRAGAESGWDYSSRWFADGRSLETIHTTDILPIDLNALLYHLEWTIAQAWSAAGDQESAEKWIDRARSRAEAIQTYLWDESDGFFVDYDFRKAAPTGVLSLAGVYPLFFRLATPEEAARVAATVETAFLREAGVVPTLAETGQQWDAPNGWAPLQWMTIRGLQDYGHTALSDTIRNRWTRQVEKIYRTTGKMVEKYDVQNPNRSAGGGEYALQDGFGWTNGVYLRLITEARKAENK